MAKQQQDRFWEVMDRDGQKHVICAEGYDVTGYGGLEFRSIADGDGRSALVASFSSYIYVKDIADAAQAGETARESDNLEAQVAAATAELTQEARQGLDLAEIAARVDRVAMEQAQHRYWFRLLQQAGYLFGQSKAELSGDGDPKAVAPCTCDGRSTGCTSPGCPGRTRQNPQPTAADAQREREAMHRVGAHQFTGRQMAAPPHRRGFFRFLPGWVSRDYGRGDA